LAARVVAFADAALSGYQSESMLSPHGVAYQSNCLMAGVFQPPNGTCMSKIAVGTSTHNIHEFELQRRNT
jgi:hypothetical protein